MSGTAKRIYTAPEDIRRLEHRIEELAVNAHVRLYLHGGGIAQGLVTVKPSIQVFKDGDANEGLNGIVKLEDPVRNDVVEEVWLDAIERIEPLDSVTPGSSKA